VVQQAKLTDILVAIMDSPQLRSEYDGNCSAHLKISHRTANRSEIVVTLESNVLCASSPPGFIESIPVRIAVFIEVVVT
jgi:hypothetical protein